LGVAQPRHTEVTTTRDHVLIVGAGPAGLALANWLALYLIRPDTYVALAESSGSPAALQVYFKDRGWGR
jgi:2-polyprenyl-6-methoxyphenol hydroxylase-like FAD-dependent oxidoreductase